MRRSRFPPDWLAEYLNSAQVAEAENKVEARAKVYPSREPRRDDFAEQDLKSTRIPQSKLT